MTFTARLKDTLTTAARHPAGRLFAALYVLAAITFVAVTGDGLTLLIQLGLTVWRLLTVLLAIALTTQPPVAWEAPPAPSRRRLWVQLAVIGVVIAATLYRGQALRSPELEAVPLIGPLTAAFNRLDFNLANPLLYVVVPLIPLLLLGARPAALGLALPATRADWGRTGLLVVVLSAMHVLYIIPALLFGNFTLAVFGRRLLTNFLQNGFAEEFLMRGALMTRLVRLSGPAWGLVGSAVVFGLWHVSANLAMFDGSLLAALSFGVISQGMAGVVYGVALRRGGNLVAPSAVHVLSHFNPF